MPSRSWFPAKMQKALQLELTRRRDDKHFTLSTSLAVCCMTTLASFPSRHVRVKYGIDVPSKDSLRTIDELADLFTNLPQAVVHTGHPIVNTLHCFVDASY